MFNYTFGGDEFLYVEVDEKGMSLEAFFQAMAICSKLKEMHINGITEICAANASYMIRFDPDVIHYQKVLSLLKDLEKEITINNAELQTRVIEFPVFYQDPYTYETLMRFRDHHQVMAEDSTFNKNTTDIEYAAAINGYKNVEDFIEAHSQNPWFVSMIGFVAGLPWLYQLVDRQKQIEVPKYLKARIDTPKLTIGHGGCFGCIYAVRGGGGYQMMGITPAPVWDPEQKLEYFKDSMVFLNPGDIIKFTPCTKEQYENFVKQVEDGTFKLKIRNANFSLAEWKKDYKAYNKQILEVLNG
ncbi:5-oxoprolinase subunit B family protein [Helicobacter sp.]|uniref:5-oxoprolinase subunit B family protein n=1 Tax=Helicobacter sp. TaxID=218 RepID=UPI0025C3405F|nr:carboxyltransferase domain-containing protein [Helicobacter sp.]MCI5968469.1 carboxyltransferase domain-containing protein [Helicobacter sp.]MDY2585254.1 carboxyltransferase domain-containing protein [Helicobacter sp.]